MLGEESIELSWYVLNLGDAMLATEQEEQIREQLERVYPESCASDSFAAYTRHEADGRLHCEVKIYFSPTASEIAKSFNARRCSQPSHIGLSLLAGSETALEILFPEEEL